MLINNIFNISNVITKTLYLRYYIVSGRTIKKF